MTSTELQGVGDPLLEWKFCVGALPAMLLIALAFHAFGLGHFLQRTFLTMPVHELGHAATAWLCGYAAIPTLWKTLVPEERGVVAPLLLAGGMGYMMWRAWQKENRLLAGLGGAVLLLLAVGTLGIKERTAEMLVVFGGDGLGMVLAVLLMASFFFGKGTQLYKGSLRWGFLAIGAAAFVDMFSTWVAARRDFLDIPYGEQEGGLLSDATRLVEEFGWRPEQLVYRYFALGVCCLAALAAVYAWGVWQATICRCVREPGARSVREVRAAPPGERDPPAAFRLVEQHGAHRAMRALLGRGARHEADPDPRGHELEDEVDLAAARGDLRRDSRLAAGAEDQPGERAAFLAQDERRGRELRQADRFAAGERVAARQQRHQRVAANVLPFEVARYRVHEAGEVDLTRTQGLLQPLSVVHTQVHLDARMAPPERGQQRGEEGARPHAREAEAQAAALQAAQLAELRDEALAIGEQAQRPAVDDFSGGGQLGALADAVEQRHPQLAFQLPDRLADGRLRREGGLGGAREAALPDHLDEHLEPAQVELYSHMAWIVLL